MIKNSLFSEKLRRLGAYVCLGAGVLSVAQTPLATVAYVYAAEEAVEESIAEEVVEQEVVTETAEQEAASSEETVEESIVDEATTEEVVEEEAAEEEVTTPVVDSLSSMSALPGELVTVSGSGFSADNNKVQFGGSLEVSGLSASDEGKTLSFTVPTDAMTDTTYSIVIVNQAGLTSNAIDGFTVASTDTNAVSATDDEVVALELSSLSPTQGPVGTEVIITGTGFTTTDNRIIFGGTLLDGSYNSDDNTNIAFNIPEGAPLGSGYSVQVQNVNGTSDGLPFEVTDGSEVSGVVLTLLTPNNGPVGTEVIITGTGFTTTDNRIIFGGTLLDGSYNSDDNTNIAFNIPEGAPLGSGYSVQVQNVNGTSDGLPFEVTAEDNGGGGGGNGGGGGGGGSSSGGCTPCYPCDQVRVNCSNGGNPITPEPEMSTACHPLLTEFIKFGANNNPDEVTKLQKFLIDHEGANITVTGFYDLATFEAVKDFQIKYSSDVLSPWGENEPTGYVFITTTLKVNLLYCDSNQSIDLDLRNYYPNPGAPGQEIGSITNDVNDDTLAVDSDATTTDVIVVATTSDEEIATSTGVFQLAAAGVLDFLGIYPWWWWLLVILLIIVISWLLKKSDDDDSDDQDGPEVVKESSYLPLSDA